jgi:hypothetical protein
VVELNPVSSHENVILRFVIIVHAIASTSISRTQDSMFPTLGCSTQWSSFPDEKDLSVTKSDGKKNKR